MTTLRLAGFLSCILGILLLFPAGIHASPALPAEFSYYALITSEDYFQEIRHYQANELIRQVIYASPFPPTVTIIRQTSASSGFLTKGDGSILLRPILPCLSPMSWT